MDIEDIGSVISRAVGECPEAQISIGGVTMTCLIDTGAQVSTVTETFFHEHLDDGQKPRDISSYISLAGAQGAEIPYVGYIERDIDICGYKLEGMGFLIVKNPIGTSMEDRKRRVPGIIGSNILGHMSRAKVTSSQANPLDPEEWRKWQHVVALYEEAQVAKQGDEGGPAVVRVAGPGPHLIPARTAIRVEGTCRTSMEEITVMIAHNQDLPALPTGLVVGHTCSTVSRTGHVSLQVSNWTDQDKYLQPRTPVAWAERVEVESKCTSPPEGATGDGNFSGTF